MFKDVLIVKSFCFCCVKTQAKKSSVIIMLSSDKTIVTLSQDSEMTNDKPASKKVLEFISYHYLD